jgi:alanine-glyoxylate transaminase/serine-glyoxylate transaminase/serine-pyruvate transaminase
MVPEPKLLLPGPTPVPHQIFQAMLTPMTNHRSDEVMALRESLTKRLQALWATGGPVALTSSSGTGALEALVTNACAPGDRVLAVAAGAFGERFGTVAERAGLQVDWLRLPWGQAADPDAVADRVRAGSYQALLLIHNETSTGVLHPIPEIAAAARRHVPLILVDSISGTPSTPLLLDPWGVDAVVATSQKGFMMPPGLGLIGLGREAVSRFRGKPHFYFDLDGAIHGEWHYTAPLSLVFALGASLDLLEEEGAAARYARHELMGRMVRAGLEALGFELKADPAFASPTVTVAKPPDGVGNHDLREWCRAHGLVIAGGIGLWRDEAIRIGHVGATGPLDMVMTLDAIELAVAELGGLPVNGRAAGAALTAWRAGLHQREEAPVSTRDSA